MHGRKPSLLIGFALLGGCFSESPPAADDMDDDAADSEASDESGAPGADAASTEGGGSDGVDETGDPNAEDDGESSGGEPAQCEAVTRSRPPIALATDLVLAIDTTLGTQAMQSVATALATVTADWIADDVHLAFVATDEYVPPWADQCATGVTLPLADNDIAHPLQQLVTQADAMECLFRPGDEATRQYAVISGRDHAPQWEIEFRDGVLADAIESSGARFNVAHANACGEAGLSLTNLAIGTCGIVGDACDAGATASFLRSVAAPRAACRWPIELPEGHDPDQLTLEAEVISLGLSLSIDPVETREDCSELSNPGNPARQWYLEGQDVVLCPGGCWLAQSTVLEDLVFHETFACD